MTSYVVATHDVDLLLRSTTLYRYALRPAETRKRCATIK